jgi:NAD(P)-dependent dehydrogenase (short-subunit alcohol dehydrogenase family)
MAPALELDGITINAVCPGVVDTAMTVEALNGADADALGFR